MSVLAVALAGVRRRGEERLAQMTAIAQAAQLALLPPLPPQLTGISIAARYRPATPGAWAGGDLYAIIPTGHGIRVIIGDVRGHGPDAVPLARHVLSAFRRSAAAAPALDQVAQRQSAGPSSRTWARRTSSPRRWPRSRPAANSPSSTAATTRRCCTTAACCGR